MSVSYERGSNLSATIPESLLRSIARFGSIPPSDVDYEVTWGERPNHLSGLEKRTKRRLRARVYRARDRESFARQMADQIRSGRLVSVTRLYDGAVRLDLGPCPHGHTYCCPDGQFVRRIPADDVWVIEAVLDEIGWAS